MWAVASLGDGTADTDGWLTMTVHNGGFKHTAQKAEHISKGSVLALTLVAGRSNGCFFMVQQPCPGSLSPGLLAKACTITYLTRWKERGTIRFIPELVHNLASALALRASLASVWASPADLCIGTRLRQSLRGPRGTLTVVTEHIASCRRLILAL